MDPASVQRRLKHDDMIPVASVYPASVMGRCDCPGARWICARLHCLAVLPASEGLGDTGSEDAGPDRFAINIARPPSQPAAGIPVFDFLPSGRGLTVHRCPHPVLVAARQQCPYHSCVLVGQGHCRHVGASSQLEPTQPDATHVAFALGLACDSSSSVDDQLARITIAALADAEHHRAGDA